MTGTGHDGRGERYLDWDAVPVVRPYAVTQGRTAPTGAVHVGLIDSVMATGEWPQPQFRPVPLNDLIRGVAQLFQAQLEGPGRAKISCELQLDPLLKPVAADGELLHRAISNLVLNAIDAMPQGGTLTLRTRYESGKALIEVADTGPGLTPKEHEQIFTPYYTNKPQGTGLGLAIVQSVVSDHGGTIRVQSEPGRGSRFVIELPDSLDNG